MRHCIQISIRYLPVTLITLLFIFTSGCTNPPESEEEDSSDLAVTEETKTEPYMIYKLYKEKSKGLRDQPAGLEMFDDFNEIYKANDVKVIGVWQNNDDPNEIYFMTAFRSDEHYQSFIALMREDSSYQEMGKKLEEDRESIEVTTLTKVKP